jgi:hypothetical protein
MVLPINLLRFFLEIPMNKFFALTLLLLQGTALAQTSAAPNAGLKYTYAELRYVDFDNNGGDGIRIGGSFDLGNHWLILGEFTDADFNNNVDASILQVGAGYVWNYSDSFDFLAALEFVRADADTPGGSSDDSGFALSGGVRGFIAPQFEVRGSVNHVNLDDSDTYLELAGDFYFTQQFAAGLSLEFAGDSDLFSIGARWYF